MSHLSKPICQIISKSSIKINQIDLTFLYKTLISATKLKICLGTYFPPLWKISQPGSQLNNDVTLLQQISFSNSFSNCQRLNNQNSTISNRLVENDVLCTISTHKTNCNRPYCIIIKASIFYLYAFSNEGIQLCLIVQLFFLP